jgi:hypothetical protein
VTTRVRTDAVQSLHHQRRDLHQSTYPVHLGRSGLILLLDRSWMYQSGDVLAHFKWVSVYLEAAAQHTSSEKEEAIYYHCKVCNNNVMYQYKDREIICEHLVWSGFMDNYFIWSKHVETQPRIESIIDECRSCV